MTMTLQASILYRPSIPQLNPLFLSLKPCLRNLSPQLSFSRRINGSLSNSFPLKSRSLRHRFCCTLNSENVNLASDSTNGNSFSENLGIIELSDGSVFSGTSAGEEVEGELKNGNVKERLPVIVFFMGVFARLKSGFEKVLYSDWFSWWPFWRQEKRLERLIAEADAYPTDAAKQSALLAELNKHRSLCFCCQSLGLMLQQIVFLLLCEKKRTD